MIDIESEVFDGAAKAAMAVCPEVAAYSADAFSPAEFPALSVVESSNVTDRLRSDLTKAERAAVVSYDVRALSNARVGAKAQAKAIAAAVDAYMLSINFTRTYMAQGAHPNNASVYQVSCRYTASVGEDGKMHRRS